MQLTKHTVLVVLPIMLLDDIESNTLVFKLHDVEYPFETQDEIIKRIQPLIERSDIDQDSWDFMYGLMSCNPLSEIQSLEEDTLIT